MLNERIENCSEIADLEGLYFVWKNLCQGVSSIDSLSNMRFHHKGKLNVNIDYTLLLFEELKLIKLYKSKVTLLLNEDLDIKSYQAWFSEKLLNYLRMYYSWKE